MGLVIEHRVEPDGVGLCCPLFRCDVCGVELTKAHQDIMAWAYDGDRYTSPMFCCVGACCRTLEARVKPASLYTNNLDAVLFYLLNATNTNLVEATETGMLMSMLASDRRAVDCALKALGVTALPARG